MPEIESGKCENATRTTKRYKKEDGTSIVEEVLKKEGVIKSHKIDGKDVLNKPDNKIEITTENSQLLSVKLLESINNKTIYNNRILDAIKTQLVEMNYYLTYLDSKADKKSIEEYFEAKGYELNRASNG